MRNEDKPGVIGAVGTVLGERGLNVSRMQLGLDAFEQVRAVLVHQHLADQRAEQADVRAQRQVFFRQVNRPDIAHGPTEDTRTLFTAP